MITAETARTAFESDPRILALQRQLAEAKDRIAALGNVRDQLRIAALQGLAAQWDRHESPQVIAEALERLVDAVMRQRELYANGHAPNQVRSR